MNDNRNDWIKYSNVEEKYIPFLQRRAGSSRIFFSVLLIAVGVLLFLGNLGILPIHSIWQFWPVTLIVSGVWMLANRNCVSGTIWGVFLAGFGTLFLLMTLGILRVRTDDASWPLSLLFIAGGTAALITVMNPVRSGGLANRLSQAFHVPLSGGRFSDLALFGSVKRKSDDPAFEGGDLMAVFGNIDFDLRRALIPAGSEFAVVNVLALFGAIKIRVPAMWRVAASGAGILGNFEDKTIPPTGTQVSTLVVTGYSVFGSVEVVD